KRIFSVEVFIPNTQKSILEVYDILGKKVKSLTIEKSIGLKTISLELATLIPGEYILIFKNNTSVIEKKIIKL
uniref:T9SS type A sorting domain-containing protein n=1 Tax=Winogradskyella sp. TaxID=1883156 RepID=UPI0025E7C6A6